MKRIWAIVAALLVSTSLFAVTGEMFTKIKGGTVSVGGTGFKLNFDAFGVEYKFVEKATILGVDAYSPGYVNITGITMGPISLGVGLTTYLGYDNIQLTRYSNDRYELNDANQKFAYKIDILPRIAFTSGKLNITTSDQSEFYIAESVTTAYKLKDDVVTNLIVKGSKTNTNITAKSYVEDKDAREDQREILVKIGANMKGLWNGELGGYNQTKLTYDQKRGEYNETLANELNTWGDFALGLSDSLEFYVKGWFQWQYNDSWKKKVTDVTNINGTRSQTVTFGPEARLQYKIAGGQVKLNLGIGLAAQLYNQSFSYTNMLNSVKKDIVVTNAINTWYTLYGVKRDDNRALMQFGGSTKFGEWEFGIDSRLALSIALYKQTEDPVTKSVTYQWMNDTAPWTEPLFIPIVKTIYLKYSKSMFSVTFNLINPDAERGSYEDSAIGFGTDATKRWFYSVDFNYKF